MYMGSQIKDLVVREVLWRGKKFLKNEDIMSSERRYQMVVPRKARWGNTMPCPTPRCLGPTLGFLK